MQRCCEFNALMCEAIYDPSPMDQIGLRTKFLAVPPAVCWPKLFWPWPYYALGRALEKGGNSCDKVLDHAAGGRVAKVLDENVGHDQ